MSNTTFCLDYTDLQVLAIYAEAGDTPWVALKERTWLRIGRPQKEPNYLFLLGGTKLPLTVEVHFLGVVNEKPVFTVINLGAAAAPATTQDPLLFWGRQAIDHVAAAVVTDDHNVLYARQVERGGYDVWCAAEANMDSRILGHISVGFRTLEALTVIDDLIFYLAEVDQQLVTGCLDGTHWSLHNAASIPERVERWVWMRDQTAQLRERVKGELNADCISNLVIEPDRLVAWYSQGRTIAKKRLGY